MHEIEYELTYLAKFIPEDADLESALLYEDHYIPVDVEHPSLRLRRRGDSYEMTKKKPLEGTDASIQLEQNIVLNEQEYTVLRSLEGKTVAKKRIKYPFENKIIEVDVFIGDLAGLVLVDFEFADAHEKDGFTPPEFCLADVTQEEFIAGGMLAGKKYADIAEKLGEFNYQKITT